MKTLITGAGGQVGIDLARALRAAGDEVYASDVGPRPASLPEGQWLYLDVTHAAQVREYIEAVKPDVVFHLAAVLSARGEKDPAMAYAVNQGGTWNVLDACRQCGVPKLIFTSSIAVFGTGLPQPVADDVVLHPATIYGITKVSGELLGEYFHHRFGLDFRAVRFPGLISAVTPGGGTSDYAPLMYLESLAHGSYEAYCEPRTRIPLMYMPDGVRALIELASVPRARLNRCVYNIAAFRPTAEEIARSVMQAVPGAKITFKPDPARQAILDSWPQAIDDRCAREDWNWSPRFDLEQMTTDLIQTMKRLHS